MNELRKTNRSLHIRSRLWSTLWAGTFFALSASTAFSASAATGLQVVHNTPGFVATASSLGPETPSKVIDVSIFLNPHNKTELDSLAEELYNPASPSYRHWLTKAEFTARYAPTAAEAKAVQDFFTANKLTIVKVGPDNFYVRARGTVAAVSSAFHVTLNNYNVNGKTVRANTSDPYLPAEVAPLAGAVYGLDSMGYTHPLVSRTTTKPTSGTTPGPVTGPAASASTKASGGGGVPALPFTSTCFTGTRTETFSGPNIFTGSPVTAAYTGNGYTDSNTGCGYTPANIQAAYNLTALYKEGFDGTGQTIVIIDWCGSPTILQDANVFSAQFGLPLLNSSNFNIIYTPTPSTCEAEDPEINIDVEWAHAIAPGAAIDLVVPPSSSFQDIDEGFFYAVDYGLGNVISGSYGSEELYTDPTVLITENLVSEIAAVEGISANFSSGDSGDFTFDYPAYYPASVSAPADAPYATAVGGISLALKSNNSIEWQSGWGSNVNPLAESGYLFDPPGGNGYFEYGSGGGPSGFFAKPSYQKKLKGTARQLPDVSWLADPFTGAYIAISVPFAIPELQYQVYGGTSLACPMFSALWAIANQEAGMPLGQAAPYLYSLPASAILDVVPVNSASNVTGKVVDTSGTTKYTAAELAFPLENVTSYVSALWDVPLEGETLLLTFGTDSGLTTAKGWDNVTGVGVPNGKAFADYFKP